MPRRALIPSPSDDSLTSDNSMELIPRGPDPVQRVSTVMVEAIDFAELSFTSGNRPSEVNDMASTMDVEFSLWWPGDTTWEEYHGPLERTEPPEAERYAAMPRGDQEPIRLRRNIRQPLPFGQGDLTDAAGSYGADVEAGSA